ncbi:hypothetical protein CPB85DRAFT_1257481 [Mucidula mucida]|nr:hypothetical protein CPB85DRAFT_1257481 [Mucidula mucida]
MNLHRRGIIGNKKPFHGVFDSSKLQRADTFYSSVTLRLTGFIFHPESLSDQKVSENASRHTGSYKMRITRLQLGHVARISIFQSGFRTTRLVVDTLLRALNPVTRRNEKAQRVKASDVVLQLPKPTEGKRDRWLALTETLEPVHAVSFVAKYATPLCAELRDAKCTSTPEVDTPDPTCFCHVEFVRIESYASQPISYIGVVLSSPCAGFKEPLYDIERLTSPLDAVDFPRATGTTVNIDARLLDQDPSALLSPSHDWCGPYPPAETFMEAVISLGAKSFYSGPPMDGIAPFSSTRKPPPCGYAHNTCTASARAGMRQLFPSDYFPHNRLLETLRGWGSKMCTFYE